MFGLANQESIVAIKFILDSVKNSEVEKRRNASLVIFDIVLNNCVDNAESDSQDLLLTLYNKALQGLESDARFQEYVTKFDQLIKKHYAAETRLREDEKKQLVALLDTVGEKIKIRWDYRPDVNTLEAKKAMRLKRELARLV